jgi:hypothetical protein
MVAAIPLEQLNSHIAEKAQTHNSGLRLSVFLESWEPLVPFV